MMTSLRWISEHQLFILATILVALTLVAFVAHKFAFRPSFKRRQLMTDNEIEFHRRLNAALPDFEIWPQVPIFALIEPQSRQGSARWKRGLRLISNRRVDRVIAQRGRLMLVIELDDKTHDPKSDKKRDQILASCEFHVLRYKSHQKPSSDTIRDDILQAFNMVNFVSFEGIDCAGKGCQVRLLADHARRSGRIVLSTREPGGTPAAEKIRNGLLSGAGVWPNRRGLDVQRGATHHLNEAIRPALARGDFVI